MVRKTLTTHTYLYAVSVVSRRCNLAMKNKILLVTLLLTNLVAGSKERCFVPYERGKDTLVLKLAVENEQLTKEWIEALKTRMSSTKLDSFARLKRSMTKEETEWKKLITSKLNYWNSIRDSLAVPFKNIELNDTINLMLGFLGVDDGFTYGLQTVCLDVTALYRAYGEATLIENASRIDRLFAHEYTHLLHKTWAQQNKLQVKTFKENVLWECLYEGIGMYRSLNQKWLPQNDALPAVARNTLNVLYPSFVENLIDIAKNDSLSDEDQYRIQKNLSRGNVAQKWGAFPVAIWLLLEANGDEKKLIPWIDSGPAAVIELAKKYLPEHLRERLVEFY